MTTDITGVCILYCNPLESTISSFKTVTGTGDMAQQLKADTASEEDEVQTPLST